jgi:hypothetical protein
MMNSTSPISISACRYNSSAASVNSLAMTAAIVYCGANSDRLTCGLLPMTMVTAIVSPSARPRPSMTAPMMPARPYVSATRIDSQRVAPSASAASRCAIGTLFRISRATDDENGITITARINAAEPMPTPSGGPVKSGNFLNASGARTCSFRTIGTSTKIPHSPYTIEGIAASSSVRYDSTGFSLPGDTSLMKMAMPSAIGVAIRSASSEE